MNNFLGCNYLFRNLNSTENPSIEIAPKDPNSNSELWVFIRCASLAKNKKYQFIAFTKGFDIILKNNYENGFVVVSAIDLMNNIDAAMIHDCSTREKVYKEANKTIQRQRSEEWYKIAANYAVRSKEVDIERVSIPPHCYFYVSCEEVLAMNYENVGKVINENDENKCNKLLEVILNNHFVGEWNAPSKISAEKEEYSKMLEDMIEIDAQFKSKRLIGLFANSFGK